MLNIEQISIQRSVFIENLIYQLLLFAIMTDTNQFNMRVSKSLLFDLEFISRATGLSKNDWVRYKLSEIIKSGKEELLTVLEKDFVKGRKSADEFKEIAGFIPGRELHSQREAYNEKFSALQRNPESEKFARKAIRTIMKK